jgi:hypothetical protein
MEVDMLHHQRSRIRPEWPIDGVSPHCPHGTPKYQHARFQVSSSNMVDIDNSWAHEICSEDNEERSLVIGSMNEMAYVFQAWLPLVVWQQVDAPEYRKGFIAVTVLSVLLIVTTFVIRFLHQKERLKRLVF